MKNLLAFTNEGWVMLIFFRSNCLCSTIPFRAGSSGSDALVCGVFGVLKR